MDSQHPVLDFVYARASLLEAGAAAESLGQPIPVSRSEHIQILQNRKKGPKLARRIAPLVVHAALHDPDFPADIDRAPLEHAERILSQESFEDWIAEMAEAVEKGQRPTFALLSLPNNKKSRLASSRKAWQQAGERSSKKIADWIVQNAPSVIAFFESREAEGGMDLKRLSKFTPKAA
ncbi:hypothetical protein [Thioalkalivibrio sp. ALE16]|uniref:hypothetical protein n=1 Tax=Thioalkalivibrio sp. ALE16 TaxID=1158172 RepID=UPI000375B80F|nr:hypothetical protein [Thioalkalivibrio sp. ALE16]